MRLTMTRGRGLSREAWALLPWVAAAIVWFGLVTPMRADQGTRLAEQSRARRDRLKSERAQHEVRELTVRMDAALATACRASTDPASLRQGAIAGTSDLDLSAFTLSVTGGSGGGAVVDASGAARVALQLLKRLGDPARGGFLRSVMIRDRGGRFSISAATGVLDSLPASRNSAAACSTRAVPAESAPEPEQPVETPKPRPLPPRPRATPQVVEPPVFTPAEAPPFALVGFLSTGGKSRVSVRLGDEVRVVSVGDQLAGWTCVSIDRDLGAVFSSNSGARITLGARP